MRAGIFAVLASFVLLSVYCRGGPDIDACRAQILDLHRSFIEAHLAEDASLLTRAITDDYLFVSDGEVSRMSGAEVRRMLQRYFDSTEFSVYRDVSDPVIEVSKDGSLAWCVAQVRVAGSRTGEDGGRQEFDTLWAWITVYERRGGEWLRTADVSTRRPLSGKS